MIDTLCETSTQVPVGKATKVDRKGLAAVKHRALSVNQSAMTQGPVAKQIAIKQGPVAKQIVITHGPVVKQIAITQGPFAKQPAMMQGPGAGV